MRQTLASQTFRSQTVSTGLLIDRLVRVSAARWPLHYGELAISKPALVVLVALATAGEPLRQARLSERTGIDRATLVRLLNELEERELAQRAADPADRRAHAVSITDAGRALLTRARELEASDDFFAALTPDERAAFDAALAKLAAAHGV